MESDLFIDSEKTGPANTTNMDGVVIGDSQHSHENTTSNQNRAYQLLINDTETISTRDLRQNDNRILSFFSKESGSNYSFRGLMRSLNIHQQSLARALDRLEDLGLIERSTSGFRLTKDGKSMTSNHHFLKENITTNIQRKYSPLLQTYIPIRIKTSEIAENLVGKWFNKLRWAGLLNDGSLYILQWVSVENGIQSGPASNTTNISAPFMVNLRLMSDYIIIETNAISMREKVDAMIASRRILHLLTNLFQKRLDSDCSSYVTPLREIYGSNN